MTVLDDGDARLAVQAPPLLARFNTAGVIAAPDVQVARRLGSLVGERDEDVLLAVALATRAVRSGSVCLHLEDAQSFAADAETPPGELPWPDPAAWRAAIEASPLVAVGVDGAADRPVRWVGGRLYLDRYWRDEMVVRRQADARLAAPAAPVDDARLAAALDRLFPDAGDALQRQAAAAAVDGRLTVLTGGPGTGKTTTVARLIAVLQDVAGPLRIALAAPTGKAAARLQEAVHEVVDELGAADRERVGTLTASTLHRLLGWLPGSATRFRHGPGRHLPHDVVVVDETSMVSLPLMARLLEALRPDARLVLVGDPDQLASVEAGAVLGDLVARTPAGDGGVVRLLTVHRQEGDSAILPLAAAVRAGDAEETLRLLRAGHPSVELVETAEDELPGEVELGSLRADAAAAGRALVHAAREGDAAAALRALGSHRLLVAHRRGPAGVAHWSALVEQWVGEAAGPHPDPLDPRSPWYPGRPILVTANDRETGLYNGDTGVVVADGEGLVAVLGDPDSPVRVRTHRLPAVETVHAMTVHRGQGSQFARVSLVLPPATSPLLTRELLYTALTRAREHVRVLGTAAAVRRAVQTPVRRASGLRTPL
ncbi:DNA helicase/exodeoxyribonuclease V, alpha subunit [Georgenia satyanarayanai]|uniref:RecBCD enzyme subunit RecD n=1 Tax=Georgenia satyanarayanai TaxID=860221 RepID=A0A2Y9BYT9_9MICO|nr:exodeoxyribonuclease V subunit alpha [Georgenia satyanarayanai]PYF99340.1 DNA helicase/exodeoxyribonuclease V alpha subunit [Georgenia satyanarayanai]SSA43152.1 DNA helicase/exodeoxyribonuclease V, alpha subunit [Georgenia satyanarayanai]